jgi:hypothetical protein
MDPLYVDHFLCVQINSHLMMMMTSPDFDVCGVVRELSGLVYFWSVSPLRTDSRVFLFDETTPDLLCLLKSLSIEIDQIPCYLFFRTHSFQGSYL